MRNILKEIDKKLWNFKIWQSLTSIPRKYSHLYAEIKEIGYDTYKNNILLEKQKAELERKNAELERQKEQRRADIELRLAGGGQGPVVSIIMPVYNTEKYLRQALDSLVEQSLPNIEIIVVDDGSTDNSLQILREYEAKDSRVRVFTQKNKYAGVARNKGLKYAAGEYVIFLDSDDYFDRELVEKAYYAARVNEAEIDVDVVMFGAYCYHEQLEKSWVGRNLLDKNYVPEEQPFTCLDCPDTIFQISTGCPWTKMFRREFIKKTKLKFQNLHNANDVYFVFSALSMAQSIVTVDEQLVTYRKGQTTNLQSSKQRYFVEAYTALYKKLKKTGKFDVLKRSYVNRAMSSSLYNLREVKDLEMKRKIYERLKNETFDKLEVLDYDSDYYYDEKNYKELLIVRNGTFEQYMEAQETQS